MTMRFENQVAVVTGAAQGIGRAVGEAFYREGASVALVDVAMAGQAVADCFGERGLFVKCDVSQAPAVEAAFAVIRERFGGVDVLVNNAGIMPYGTVLDCTEEQWNRVMGVNVKGAFLCARSVIPGMIERGKGVIINMASAQSFMSQANVAAYTTSKTALLGLTRSIAVDYAPKIRSVAVCPSTVATPLLDWAIEQSPDPQAVRREIDAMHLVGRVADPDEIAELVLYLCSDKAGFITGRPIQIDGGIGVTIPGSKRE
jgi:NAD(P)-dependent dehydrogenase (short-subunit alcohol dehydrogenase family)